MNISNLTSENQDQNISSFFNQSSCSVQPCCDYRSRYKQLYKDLSNLRIEYRNLKQQNTNLKNNAEGMQEQLNLLQQIMNNKKEIIIRTCNEQINRLEDQINQIATNNKDLQQKLNDSDRFLQELQNNLNQQRQINKTKISLNQKLQKELLEVQKQRQKIKFKAEKDNKKITRQKSQIIANLNQFLQNYNKQVGLTQNCKAIQGIKSQGISSSQQLKPIDSWSQIQPKIVQMLEQYKRQQDLLINKDLIINELNSKNLHLQSQINSSLELFQQQMKQITNLKTQAKQQKSQLQQTLTARSKAQKQNYLVYLLQSITSILRNTFYRDIQNLLNQMLSLAENSINKFETQVIVNQIRVFSQETYNKMLKQQISTKQYEKMCKNYQQYQQNYQLLQLKFKTLERSYRQVIEDNNRLIKFNHLTQYRINRNIEPLMAQKTKNNQKSQKPVNSNIILGKYKGLRYYNKQNVSLEQNL